MEDRPAPSTDEEALEVLRGDIKSDDFMTEYHRLRGGGMGVEQARIFVGHEFRLRHQALEVSVGLVGASAGRSHLAGFLEE